MSMCELTSSLTEFAVVQAYSLGEYATKACAWMNLLSLSARLALTCSALGLLLVTYQGSENATYHLFPPGIPWLMPVTVGLTITVLMMLGLQTSSVLQTLFNISFSILLLVFLSFALNELYQKGGTLFLEIDILEKVPEGIIYFLNLFMIDSNGKRMVDRLQTLTSFGLHFLGMGTLSFLYDSRKCNFINVCFKTDNNWYGPVTLGLVILSLGLTLPDLFAAVQDILNNTLQLQEFIILLPFKASIFNSTLITGIICTTLIYLCSTFTLIMICGSSLIVSLLIEKLSLLNMVVYSDSDCMTSDGYGKLEEYSQKSADSSDSESGSDIDLIVEQYKSHLEYTNGFSERSNRKRLSYIYRISIVFFSAFSVIFAFALQNLHYLITVGLTLGLIVLVFIQQWVSNKFMANEGKSPVSVLSTSISYAVNVIMLISIPKNVWSFLSVWIFKGVTLYFISKIKTLPRKLNYTSKIQTKQILSFQESPPVFGTTCKTSFPS